MSECQHHDYTMVEDYIRGLQWSADATDHEKTLVAGNIRGFYEHVRAALSLPRQSEAVGYTSQSALNSLAKEYASGVMFGAYSERYERTIPLYTTPAAEQGDAELAAWRELSLACSIPSGVIWPNSWPQDVAIVAHLIWTLQTKLDTIQPAQADTTAGAHGVVKECEHETAAAQYDHVRCIDCGSIRTDGEWGIASHQWFKSVAVARFYREKGYLPSQAASAPGGPTHEELK